LLAYRFAVEVLQRELDIERHFQQQLAHVLVKGVAALE
jgi:hypothetical protein